MEPNEYFYKILQIEPIYKVEGYAYRSFYEFESRFQSLQRHWQLNKSYISSHISILERVRGDGSAEFDHLFSETVGFDMNYFPEYLRLSTISFALSLVENLLGTLSEEIAEDLNVNIDLDKKQMPYVNKYILWLVRGCGIQISIDKILWKNLDAIREMRNRFIHRIDRDIPDQVKKIIGEMVSSVINDDNIITDEFVDASFVTISKIVKKIELAYIKFCEEQHSIKRYTPEEEIQVLLGLFNRSK